MGVSPLAKKLLIKPGQRAVIINPPAGYLDELGELPEGVDLAESAEGGFDFVHLFVRNGEELGRFAKTALGAVRRDGVLWVSYPKGSSKVKTDINRDSGWGPFNEAGFRAVTQIAVNDIWSALRFRPMDQVKSR